MFRSLPSLARVRSRLQDDPFVPSPYLVLSIALAHITDPDFLARAKCICKGTSTDIDIGRCTGPTYADDIQKIVDHLSRFGVRTYDVRQEDFTLLFSKSKNGAVKMIFKTNSQHWTTPILTSSTVQRLKRSIYDRLNKEFWVMGQTHTIHMLFELMHGNIINTVEDGVICL